MKRLQMEGRVRETNPPKINSEVRRRGGEEGDKVMRKRENGERIEALTTRASGLTFLILNNFQEPELKEKIQ